MEALMARKSHRKRKVFPRPQYKVAVHQRHPSGIGSTFLRYEFTDTKPTFDTHWRDDTNGEWARYNTAPYNVFQRTE
jgi:hypothetical protein